MKENKFIFVKVKPVEEINRLTKEHKIAPLWNPSYMDKFCNKVLKVEKANKFTCVFNDKEVFYREMIDGKIFRFVLAPCTYTIVGASKIDME